MGDIRYALRGFRRAPVFTATAILSLALGIGANTAIFSLLYTVVLRLLPVENPRQLVELLTKYPGEPRFNGFDREAYQHFRKSNHVFSNLIGATSPSNTRLLVTASGGESERLDASYVTGDYFHSLGVMPAIGRLLRPEDSAAAVVSYSYWANRLHLDAQVPGKTILVENQPLTIIGVAPPQFTGWQLGAEPQIYLPWQLRQDLRLQLVGRLKPGVSIEEARAEMKVLFQPIREEMVSRSGNSAIRQMTFHVEPAGAGLSHIRDRYGAPLTIVMAIVAVLLLLACTNVAGLILARATARQDEMALRVAIGAERIHLFRQLLTESFLLSAAGGLLGVVLAWSLTSTLLSVIASGRRGIEFPVQPDLNILLFNLGLVFLATTLCSLAPALTSAAFTNPAASLRTTKATQTLSSRRFSNALITAQLALSVILLSAAALFLQHLSHLRNLDLGFERDRVLILSLDASRSGYEPGRLALAYKELLARLEAIPGVLSATASGMTPLSGAGASRFATAEGHHEDPNARRYAALNWVAPKYFQTYGTPLLAGRDFTFQDQGAAPVAIINQSMAAYYFPQMNPLGKHIGFDKDPNNYEVIGVVRDANYYELRESTQRTTYLFAFQTSRVYTHQFSIRTAISPSSVAPAATRAVREMLKTVTVTKVTTLAAQADATIVPERLTAQLAGLFGVFALLLAVVGLNGILATSVARRTAEIGVRMALGATPANALRMVLGDALKIVVAGGAIGLLTAYWARRYAASLLEDLPLESPLPLFLAYTTLLAAALLAAFFPARHAAGVDPATALRGE